MKIHTLFALRPALAGFALIVSFGSVHAAVTVNSSVVLNAGIYTYSYTVSNIGTTFDLAVVDIPVGSGVAINNLTSPTGFGAIFDGAPINLVSFFEDSDAATPQTFAPNSVSGTFSYQSNVGPSVVTFSALDSNGTTFTGSTQSAVPEPSAMLLLGTAVIPLLITRKRRADC